MRRLGLILAMLGIVATAILLTVHAWLSRRNGEAFNTYVGWANIASLSVGAIGTIIVIAEKLGSLGGFPRERMIEIAGNLAREAMRQDGLLLAQLLGTDELSCLPAHSSFVPSNISTRNRPSGDRKSRSRRREFSEITDFYLNETRKRMVVLGAPGTGKTVLAVSLTVDLLRKRATASTDETATPVPCLLNLSSWDPTSIDLSDWLEKQLIKRFRLGRKIAEKLVRDGWIMPVLDGLDEMDSQDDQPSRSQNAVFNINGYMARTPDCRIVVICRSGSRYYDRLARRIRNVDEITVESLNSQQVTDYIQSQCQHMSSLDAWRPVFKALASRDSSLILSQLNTPWRLTAAVTFSLSGGDPALLLPTSIELHEQGTRAVYSKRVSSLLMEALLTARIRIHSKRGVSPKSTIDHLRCLSRLIYANGSNGNEIVLRQWWQTFNSSKIRNTPKVIAMQALVMWTMQHLGFGLLGFLPFSAPKEQDRHWFIAIAILANYCTIMMYSIHKAIAKKDPIRLNITSLRTLRYAAVTATAVAGSAVIGVLAAIAYGILYGIGSGAAFLTVLVLIIASVNPDPVNNTRPMGALVDDRNFCTVMGVALASYAMLYYITLYGWQIAVSFATMCFFGSLFSSFYIRYLVAVYYGHRFGLPFRFAKFLARCRSAGIMRISGVSYQFRHQEIFEYLAQPIAGSSDESH